MKIAIFTSAAVLLLALPVASHAAYTIDAGQPGDYHSSASVSRSMYGNRISTGLPSAYNSYNYNPYGRQTGYSTTTSRLFTYDPYDTTGIFEQRYGYPPVSQANRYNTGNYYTTSPVYNPYNTRSTSNTTYTNLNYGSPYGANRPYNPATYRNARYRSPSYGYVSPTTSAYGARYDSSYDSSRYGVPGCCQYSGEYRSGGLAPGYNPRNYEQGDYRGVWYR